MASKLIAELITFKLQLCFCFWRDIPSCVKFIQTLFKKMHIFFFFLRGGFVPVSVWVAVIILMLNSKPLIMNPKACLIAKRASCSQTILYMQTVFFPKHQGASAFNLFYATWKRRNNNQLLTFSFSSLTKRDQFSSFKFDSHALTLEY